MYVYETSTLPLQFNKIYCLYNPLTQNVTFGNQDLIDYWNRITQNKIIHKDSTIYQKLLLQNKFIYSKEQIKDNNLKKKMEQWKNGEYEISQLYLIINRKCNFKCKYCRQFVNKSNPSSDIMTKEVAFEAVKFFLEQKNKKKKGIVFYGGEPALSYPVLIDLIRYIRNFKNKTTDGKDVEINIFTNGTLVSPKIAKFLAKNNVFIIISYDGLPNQNDNMRIFPNGKGTSSHIVKGIDIYKNAGCKTGISLTIGAHNIHDIKGAVDHIKSLNAINLGFNLPHDDEDNPLRPQSENNSWLEDLINFFWNETKKGLYVEHIIRKLKLFVMKTIKLCECPATNGRIVVLPNKSVGLCEGAIGYDHFFHDNLYNINYLKSESHKWKNNLPIFDNRCQDCPAISICGGGCMLDGYFETNTLTNYDTIRCKFSKILIRKILTEIHTISKGKDICWNISDEDRKKLWKTFVHNKENKPLTTSANFGEFSLETENL